MQADKWCFDTGKNQIYYFQLSKCKKFGKSRDFLEINSKQYRNDLLALDAPNVIKVGKRSNFYKNQFLDWVTVSTLPPIVTVPDRETVGFTVTQKLTVPPPLRESGPNAWIHFTLLLTV